MATRTAAATFECASFQWADGRYTLTGAWSGGDGLGPVRLLVTVDGEPRRVASEGSRVPEDGPRWGARFRGDRVPDAGAPVALVASGLQFELPAPQVDGAGHHVSEPRLPPPPPAPPVAEDEAAVPAAVTVPAEQTEADELRGLIEQLRAERQAADQARERLALERQAAEQLQTRLGARPARRPLPAKREPAADVDYTPAYWVGALALFLFFVVLVWVF